MIDLLGFSFGFWSGFLEFFRWGISSQSTISQTNDNFLKILKVPGASIEILTV
jgi:hypothetical protein